MGFAVLMFLLHLGAKKVPYGSAPLGKTGANLLAGGSKYSNQTSATVGYRLVVNVTLFNSYCDLVVPNGDINLGQH